MMNFAVNFREDAFTPRFFSHITADHKIGMLQIVRGCTNMGPKDAKELVERWINLYGAKWTANKVNMVADAANDRNADAVYDLLTIDVSTYYSRPETRIESLLCENETLRKQNDVLNASVDSLSHDLVLVRSLYNGLQDVARDLTSERDQAQKDREDVQIRLNAIIACLDADTMRKILATII